MDSKEAKGGCVMAGEWFVVQVLSGHEKKVKKISYGRKSGCWYDRSR